MEIKFTLSADEVKALLYWHTKSADFGDVEHETGVDLINTIYRLAAQVHSTTELNKLVDNLVPD